MELGFRMLSFGFAPELYKLETQYEMQTPPGVQKDVRNLALIALPPYAWRQILKQAQS